MKSFDQVGLGLIQNLNIHEVCSEMRFLAVSQSVNRALFSWTSRSRSSRRSLCHCGTGTVSACLDKSAQSASIVRSFSSNVRLFNPAWISAKLMQCSIYRQCGEKARRPEIGGQT